MGIYGVKMKGVLPWASHSGARDFYPALAALVRPVQQFFPTAHFFTLCFPIAQLPDQAVVLGRLSLNMCPWSCPFLKGPTGQIKPAARVWYYWIGLD